MTARHAYEPKMGRVQPLFRRRRRNAGVRADVYFTAKACQAVTAAA